MTRHGKIARMPPNIRRAVNIGLDHGAEGAWIIEWLNERPEVRKVLDQWFEGRPVTKQNLSEWRKGGYREWQRQEQVCDLVRRMTEKADALDLAANPDAAPASDRFSTVLLAELIGMAQVLLEENADTKERWRRLRELFGVLSQIRRADARAGRLTLDRTKWHVAVVQQQADRKEEAKAMPAVNLLMEECAHRLMATGKRYDRRTKDILNRCFRPGENGGGQAAGTQDPPEEAPAGRRRRRRRREAAKRQAAGQCKRTKARAKAASAPPDKAQAFRSRRRKAAEERPEADVSANTSFPPLEAGDSEAGEVSGLAGNGEAEAATAGRTELGFVQASPSQSKPVRVSPSENKFVRMGAGEFVPGPVNGSDSS